MKKTCTRCQNTKEISEFHNNIAQNDGLDTWCIECRKQYRKEYMSKENAERRRKEHAGTTQKCSGCWTALPIEAFQKDSGSATGYHRMCPKCRKTVKMRAEFIKFIQTTLAM